MMSVSLTRWGKKRGLTSSLTARTTVSRSSIRNYKEIVKIVPERGLTVLVDSLLLVRSVLVWSRESRRPWESEGPF
jgi:hypothetical protein